MNTDTKYLLNNNWRVLETIETKWCIGIKRVMFLLHMYAFISLYNGSFSIFGFSSAETFFIRATIHFTGTAIVMNKCYVFLARTLNRIFVLLAMLFQYIATIIRGMNPEHHDGAFYQNRSRILAPSLIFGRVLNSSLTKQKSLQRLFFLRITRKGRYESWVHIVSFRKIHCMKNVRIRSYSGPSFSRIRTEYGDFVIPPKC